MVEILLSQRFNYAEIWAYKDYSKIKDKPSNSLNTFDIIDDPNEDGFRRLNFTFDDNLSPFRSEVLRLSLKSEHKKKNTKYYYSNQETGYDVNIKNYRKDDSAFITDNDRHIKAHYARPLSKISVFLYERSVIRNGDKLTFKFQAIAKRRQLNSRFFKKTKSVFGFSFNTKTGDFIIFDNGRVRKNHFKSLHSLFNQVNFLFLSKYMKSQFRFYDTGDNSKVINKITNIFNDDEFVESVFQTLGYTSAPLNPKDYLLDVIGEKFMATKGIKAPNEYRNLLYNWYPTKKYLVKNENKLAASVADRLGIKSKHIIKLLHGGDEVVISRIEKMLNYFGATHFHKYVANIREEFFTDPSIKKGFNDTPSYQNRFTVGYYLRPKEMSNLVKLLNLFVEEAFSRSNNFTNLVEPQLRLLDDHFSMINMIREYYPNTEMRADTWTKFTNEHTEFSKIQRTIKKGYTTEYIFEQNIIDYIEEPIKIFKSIDIGPGLKGTDMDSYELYYPVLLRKDIEYSEEGAHMHHCVASYIDTETSVIVSLRHLSLEGHERVTSEFKTHRYDCIQSRYFCNATPPEHFERPLNILKERIEKWQTTKPIKSLEKVRIPLIINGKEVATAKAKTTDPYMELLNMI
jgi:hypothetical protein